MDDLLRCYKDLEAKNWLPNTMQRTSSSAGAPISENNRTGYDYSSDDVSVDWQQRNGTNGHRRHRRIRKIIEHNIKLVKFMIIYFIR